MLKSNQYLKTLFSILSLIMVAVMVYIYYFNAHYPLPFTSRISLDAKIKFVRNHIDADKVDTIIVGSSIGLNNVQAPYLEKSSDKVHYALNLSVYEASALQVEKLFQLSEYFPHLKRVVYSVQFSDFQHASHFKNFDIATVGKYMTHTLNPFSSLKFVFDASKDLRALFKRQETWEEKHGKNYKFTYLGFDKRGSVPLHIYGKHIIQSRWAKPHGSRHLNEPFDAVDRMAKKAKEKGFEFYLVQQPYRQELIKKHWHIPAELNWFLKRVTSVVEKNQGHVLSLYKTLPLDDRYFADRSHLNDKGSILSAEAIGKFIDKTENKKEK